MDEFPKGAFVTTLKYPNDPEFCRRGRVISNGSRTSVLDKLKFVSEVLQAAKETKIVLLDST